MDFTIEIFLDLKGRPTTWEILKNFEEQIRLKKGKIC